MKTVTLECGHEVEWKDWGDPGQEDYPWIGRLVWCAECDADQEISDINMQHFNRPAGSILVTREEDRAIIWEHDIPEFMNADTFIDALRRFADKDQYAGYGYTIFATPGAIDAAVVGFKAEI